MNRTNFNTGETNLDRALEPLEYEQIIRPKLRQNNSQNPAITQNLFQEKPPTEQEQKQREFNLSFNNKFNEQFNRDYKKQQEALVRHNKFLRTRQSIEVERMDRVGAIQDHTPYRLYEENELKPTTIRQQAFGHQNVECNLLNQAFMSPENIETLQQLIQYNVYISSGKQHLIGRQSDTELQIIMRSIYFTYGKNLPYNIKEQIRDLNDLVVQEATSRILSQIQQHLYYLFDANTQPTPLAYGAATSSVGKKQLGSVTSVFFG